jgi:hypothetical protein
MLRRAFSQGGTRQVPSKPDEKYWLERAKEAFTQVERLMHPEAKRMMLENRGRVPALGSSH